jgi:hypothetical protein
MNSSDPSSEAAALTGGFPAISHLALPRLSVILVFRRLPRVHNGNPGWLHVPGISCHNHHNMTGKP